MMGLTVSESSGTTFKSAPAGTHVARCIRLIDIGTQHGEYQGKATVRKQIIVMWELPNETMDDGKHYIASKFYTASLSEKATLRKDLESWRGRAFTDEELAGFDLKNILGKPCMLSIVAKEGGNGTKVGGVMALPKGMQVPPHTNEPWAFDIDAWDDERFQAMKDGIKKLIQGSDEFQAIKVDAAQAAAPAEGVAGIDEDIPF
jgi:hypothetical protein